MARNAVMLLYTTTYVCHKSNDSLGITRRSSEDSQMIGQLKASIIHWLFIFDELVMTNFSIYKLMLW